MKSYELQTSPISAEPRQHLHRCSFVLNRCFDTVSSSYSQLHLPCQSFQNTLQSRAFSKQHGFIDRVKFRSIFLCILFRRYCFTAFVWNTFSSIFAQFFSFLIRFYTSRTPCKNNSVLFETWLPSKKNAKGQSFFFFEIKPEVTANLISLWSQISPVPCRYLTTAYRRFQCGFEVVKPCSVVWTQGNKALT